MDKYNSIPANLKALSHEIFSFIAGLFEASSDSGRSNSLGKQFFRIRPANQTVREGDDIELKCQIGNLQGRVQWTRNGFAMGKVSLVVVRAVLSPNSKATNAY